jgi:peptide deformylase
VKIITVPHPTLRTPAQEVTKVDNKLKQFLSRLGTTLADTKNPRGVGLAAPQVDKKWRIFATHLEPSEDQPPQLRTFINPRILDHSDNLTFGPDPKEPRLEGCLSIPGIYGPVPRWQWVELAYYEVDDAAGSSAIEENNPSGESQLANLIEQRGHFEDFAARVIQHEYDHLEGVLFTDYVIEHDLPLYQENKQTKQLDEIDPNSLSYL